MNIETGLWDCKKCGLVGNYFQYLKMLKDKGERINFNYIEDIKKVKTILINNKEKENNKVNDFVEPLEFLPIEIGDEYDTYFVKKRKFSRKLIKKYLLFRSSKNDFVYRDRIIIPIFDEYNRIRGYCARTIRSSVERKYYNSKGTCFSELLFNYNNVKNNEYKFVVIVEGIFDCLRLHKFSVATFGKKISKHQISLLQDLDKQIILMFDKDARKELYKYYFELSQIFDDKKLKVFELPFDDPDVFFKKYSDQQKIKLIMKNSFILSSENKKIKLLFK